MTDDDDTLAGGSDENSVSLTLRGLSVFFDQYSTAQAKKAGKPKGTYVREYLEDGLSDPLGNFARTNPLSISLDEEMAEYVGGKLDEKSYQNYSPVQHHLAYRELLNLKSDSDLKNILFGNTPCLLKRADQVLTRSDQISRGVSLAFALFCELAGRDIETIEKGWERIFRSDTPGEHERYLQHIDEIRRVKKLELLYPAIEHTWEWGNISIYRPDSYDHGAWRVLITLNKDNEITWSIRFPILASRLLTANPGYVGMSKGGTGESLPGFRFQNHRCELHLYTNGISEEDNPVTPKDVIHHLADAIESNLICSEAV